MAQRFEFDASEVLALVAESEQAKQRLLTEAQRYVAAGIDLYDETAEASDEIDAPEDGAPPGLWLMNDRGIYLRSNARKRPDAHVAHARGYRAKVQVGDESICEFIDASPLAQLRPDDTLVIAVDERKIRLSVIREV